MANGNERHLMQCGCGMVGFGERTDDPKVFRVKSKDGPRAHMARLSRNEKRQFRFECLGET